MENINPADQFQIGDRVLFEQEGVITIVSGYLWEFTVGGALPRISAYKLDCGCVVPKSAIKHYSHATRIGPDYG